MFERKDISKEVISFVKSNSFNDFKAIMEDFAAAKFTDIQGADADTSHAEMIANRKILNFYLNLPKDIEFRYSKLMKEREREAERS